MRGGSCKIFPGWESGSDRKIPTLQEGKHSLKELAQTDYNAKEVACGSPIFFATFWRRFGSARRIRSDRSHRRKGASRPVGLVTIDEVAHPRVGDLCRVRVRMCDDDSPPDEGVALSQQLSVHTHQGLQ